MVLFGAPTTHRVVAKVVQWPQFDKLGGENILDQFEQESLLRDNKITAIEWTTVDTICTMRFTFQNGTRTPILGNRLKLKKSYKFPRNVSINKVSFTVRGDMEFIDSLTFYDQKGGILVGIKGENVKGKLYTLDLSNEETIIGIKATMCEKYIRGLGFYVWKVGMGVPNDLSEDIKEKL